VTSPVPTVRRRLQRQVWRAQGRLDGTLADRSLPWIFAALVFVLAAGIHLARIRSLDPTSGLAPWLQAAWRRAHGGSGTPMVGIDPAQGSPIAEPILWLARWVDTATLLAVVQAAALALTVPSLWRLGRDEAHLRVGAIATVVGAFVLAPTLQRANLGAFHPELIALPALVAAYVESRLGRWVRFGALVAFVLLCRADLGITVAALGVVLALDGRRRAGTITALAGTAWTVTALAVLRPTLPIGELTPAGEFVARSTGPLAAVGEVVAHPASTLATMVAEPSVRFLVIVLVPVLFLPLVSPRRFAIGVPALVFAIVADGAVREQAGRGVLDLAPAAAHTAPTMAFAFVALVFALERIGVRSVRRVNVDRRVLLALLAGAFLLFVTEAPTSPYREPWTWGSRDAIDGTRLQAADLVPDDAGVAASPSMTALLAERATVRELPLAPQDLTAPRLAGLPSDISVVVLDTGVDPATPGAPTWTDDDRVAVRDRLRSEGFTEAEAVGQIMIFTR
jgi:hypothetical protein